jgi:DNA modification methylase
MEYKSHVEPKAHASGVPVYCAHDEIVPVEKVIANPKNPNTHPDGQIEVLSRIIQSTGWRQPITVSARSGFIVKGHGRLMAAIKAGLTEVPVDYQNYTNEAEEYADLVADNRIQEFSVIDQELLADILASIDDSDVPIELTGYTEDESNEIQEAINNVLSDKENLSNIEEDEYEDDEEHETFSQTHDIWILGNHRLMVGDSTSKDDIERLTNGNEIDLVVTDPPYNVDITGGGDKKLKIANDNMENDEFQKFLENAFNAMASQLKRGGSYYVWYASRTHVNFETALNAAGLQVREQLIWYKNTFTLGRQDYQWIHEPCLYGWKEGGPHYFIDNRTLATVQNLREMKDVSQMTKPELVQALNEILDTPTTIIEENKPTRNELHPTMKPVKLIATLVRNSSKPGWNVMDPFGGSGTTLIACQHMDRRCFMMEYDPYYADAIVRRYANLVESTDDIKLIRDDKEIPYNEFKKIFE